MEPLQVYDLEGKDHVRYKPFHEQWNDLEFQGHAIDIENVN